MLVENILNKNLACNLLGKRTDLDCLIQLPRLFLKVNCKM